VTPDVVSQSESGGNLSQNPAAHPEHRVELKANEIIIRNEERMLQRATNALIRHGQHPWTCDEV
jgi:hypothetical protein